MSLDKVLKTVYVVGDFGERKRDEGFFPFTGSIGPQALDYSAFVKYFGVSTPELGVLDEGNPFYRILRPWSPPDSPVAAGASEMAAVVVGAIPGIVREAAKALADFEAAVQPLGALAAYKDGEKDEGETPKAYAELLDSCCSDNAALAQTFEKFGLSDKLVDWSAKNNELLERLRATDRTFSEFAKRTNNTNNLFQVLLKKRIQDVVDEAVQKLQDSFNAKAQAEGFKANGSGPILDVTTVGNELEKAAFITALVTKDAGRFERDSFDCTVPDELFELWKEFVIDENECDWASGAVVPSAQVETEWKKFIKRRKDRWKTKYDEEMPDLRELELRVFFYAFAGAKSLSEERVAELAYFAMNGIGLASRDDAQAAIAVANSLGIDANRSKKPSRGEHLEVDVENDEGVPDKYANSTEASWHGEDKKNIRKHANLIRVLTFYMSVVTDPAKRKLIASLLLTARGKTSNLMKHLKSLEYIKLIDSLVGEASEAYRKLLETKEEMASAGARVAGGEVSTRENKETQPSCQVQQASPDTVIITAQGEEGSHIEGSTIEGSTIEGSTTEGSTTEGSTTEGSTTEGSTTEGSTTEGLTTEGLTDGPPPPQFQQLKDAFRSLGHPADGGESTAVPNPPASRSDVVQEDDGQPDANRFKLDELYVSLHKAMSQLAKNERATEASAAGQLEKSVMQYLTIMFMQRQGIDFGEEEAASLGWIFELSRYGTDEEVLRNVPLNQLLTMGSNKRLKDEWKEVESEFQEMLGSASERLSKLYGIEILLKSAPKECVIWFYNGSVDNSLQELEKADHFKPSLIDDTKQGVPIVIYFADQQKAVISALQESPLLDRLCPIIIDAGPNYDTGEPWNSNWETRDIPSLSLAGPGIRIRGVADIDGKLKTQNDGLPTSPLIPAGAICVAALLDGNFKDGKASLTAVKEDSKDAGTTPFPTNNGLKKDIRFLLHSDEEDPKSEGDLIDRTKRVLAKSGLVYDIAIWLGWLAKQKGFDLKFQSNCFPPSLNVAGVVEMKQAPDKGPANSRPWQILISGSVINPSSFAESTKLYLTTLHPN